MYLRRKFISAGISLGRGDYTGAVIGLGSMLPLAGKPFEAMKIARAASTTLQLTAKARTAENALALGGRVLGKGYNEIAPGVFRSVDGLKQFRMTNSDLAGKAFNGIPHVHIEVFSPSSLTIPLKNYHIPLK